MAVEAGIDLITSSSIHLACSPLLQQPFQLFHIERTASIDPSFLPVLIPIPLSNQACHTPRPHNAPAPAIHAGRDKGEVFEHDLEPFLAEDSLWGKKRGQKRQEESWGDATLCRKRARANVSFATGARNAQPDRAALVFTLTVLFIPVLECVRTESE